MDAFLHDLYAFRRPCNQSLIPQRTLLQMFSLALILMNVILAARASIYVVKPLDGSTCHASASCSVQWEDDGQRPLLSAIEMTTVGLYHGNQVRTGRFRPSLLNLRNRNLFRL